MSTDLDRIAEFLWLEADMLDQKDYADWLELWDDDGLYVVPVERCDTDFASRINFAYDDAAMRAMRVRRLTSGESVSASSAATTVRTVSRFRRLDDQSEGRTRVRCAQNLVEHRHGNMRIYSADVTFCLRHEGQTFRILEKVVQFANSTEALAGITFLP